MPRHFGSASILNMTIVRQEDHPSRPKWRGIGAKVILIVIVVNAALSLAATATQLYLGYQRDRGIVLSETTLIENSFKASIETALWEFNFPLIEAQYFVFKLKFNYEIRLHILTNSCFFNSAN